MRRSIKSWIETATTTKLCVIQMKNLIMQILKLQALIGPEKWKKWKLIMSKLRFAMILMMNHHQNTIDFQLHQIENMFGWAGL